MLIYKIKGVYMFEYNNILAFIFTFLPALIYSIIVYANTPPFTIKWKIASLFFLMGILSVTVVTTVHFIFPLWDYFPLDASNMMLSLFFSAIVKVGLLEEGSKFLMFRTTEYYRNKKYTDHPSAIMFYAMSVSCGFAVMENIMYARSLGGEVLLIRSFTSVIVHMICGLMMGYFVALGNLKSISYPKTILNRIKALSFVVAGVFTSTFYHGLFDFSIDSGLANGENPILISIVIILVGLALTFMMSSHLFRFLKK